MTNNGTGIVLFAALCVVPLVGLATSCGGTDSGVSGEDGAGEATGGAPSEWEDGVGGSGTSSTGGSNDDSLDECGLPRYPQITPVPIETKPGVSTIPSGGEVYPGTYVVKAAWRPIEAAPTSDEEFEMQFELADDGTGVLSERLGLAVYSYRITWSTEGTMLTFTQQCPEPLGNPELYSTSYDYSSDSEQISLVIDETLVIFDRVEE